MWKNFCRYVGNDKSRRTNHPRYVNTSGRQSQKRWKRRSVDDVFRGEFYFILGCSTVLYDRICHCHRQYFALSKLIWVPMFYGTERKRKIEKTNKTPIRVLNFCCSFLNISIIPKLVGTCGSSDFFLLDTKAREPPTTSRRSVHLNSCRNIFFILSKISSWFSVDFLAPSPGTPKLTQVKFFFSICRSYFRVRLNIAWLVFKFCLNSPAKWIKCPRWTYHFRSPNIAR